MKVVLSPFKWFSVSFLEDLKKNVLISKWQKKQNNIYYTMSLCTWILYVGHSKSITSNLFPWKSQQISENARWQHLAQPSSTCEILFSSCCPGPWCYYRVWTAVQMSGTIITCGPILDSVILTQQSAPLLWDAVLHTVVVTRSKWCGHIGFHFYCFFLLPICTIHWIHCIISSFTSDVLGLLRS